MIEAKLKEQIQELTEELSMYRQKIKDLYLTSNKPKRNPLQVPLTPREIQIIKLICKGLATKQIADKLCIANSTVTKHRENIATKIGARCVIDVMRFALNHGII